MERAARVVVVGAGMAGILAAIELQEAGYSDITVYEKAERAGGTWRENTYPGIACDVPSHLYSYSFAPNPEWSHVFSPGSEIWAYLEDVARAHGVDGRIRFGSEVTQMTYEAGRWHLELGDGGTDVADVVIAATGVLHHPRYPDIDGLDRFQGAQFHSARWDHDVPLDGQRVGVVGTGSTAVQITGALVDVVGDLRLFQRTAPWIMPALNPPISDDERALYLRDADAMRARRAELAAVFEGSFGNAVIDAESKQAHIIADLCRANLEEGVRDPELRERLRPTYRAACKRLILSSDFYEAIQRPNAHLVTAGIDHVEEAGVRTVDGQLHELDVLALATGFQVDRFVRPMEVIGRGGVALSEVWAQRPSAYLSISIPGFPNLFMLNGPNGPVGNFSLISVAELQMQYVRQLLEVAAGEVRREVSARPEALARMEEERLEAVQRTVWVTGCNSWYLDDRGIPAVWPFSIDRFKEEMARPRWDDFEVHDLAPEVVAGG